MASVGPAHFFVREKYFAHTPQGNHGGRQIKLAETFYCSKLRPESGKDLSAILGIGLDTDE